MIYYKQYKQILGCPVASGSSSVGLGFFTTLVASTPQSQDPVGLCLHLGTFELLPAMGKSQLVMMSLFHVIVCKCVLSVIWCYYYYYWITLNWFFIGCYWNSLYLFVVGLVIHDQQIPISMSKDSIACRSSTSWGPQPWLQRRLWIPPKRCDPPGVLDSPIGSRENLQTLQETNWRVESMVSCKFPLNQTMRIINLLRMLRVQPYNYLKSLTHMLLLVPLAQEIIKKIGEACFNEASNGAVSSCWLCRVTGCNCNTTGWVWHGRVQGPSIQGPCRLSTKPQHFRTWCCCRMLQNVVEPRNNA